MVGGRAGNDDLYRELNSDPDRLANAGIRTMQSIGDCHAPGSIAHAVYSGHECARNMDADDATLPFAMERARI